MTASTSTVTDELNPYRLIGPSEGGEVTDLLEKLDAKAARLRLQALIAEWLRMENLVVLTAAGASVSSGGKTMLNLETSVFSTLKAMIDIPASIVKIIDERIASTASTEKPLAMGFEDWLSFIVNASYIGSHKQSPFNSVTWRCAATPAEKELEWFIEKIGKAIFAECSLILPDTTDSIAPHLPFLAKLVARESNLGRTHLFTLNYDTLLEQALELLGIQYFDGFTGRTDARFDPSVYGLDIYYPGEIAEGRVRRFDKFLHFYKLHGSIHWWTRDSELCARHPDLRMVKDYRDLATPEDKAERLKELADRIPSVGILPTANKFVQTLTMPFAHLFRSFQIRLSAPQTFLLVLGYGFGDDHVNSIIEAALMNPSLIMLVVEPNPESPTIERIKRYRDLGKRAFVLTSTNDAFTAKKFKYATFDDFAQSVMPDVQWLEDFLRLRRFEKQIMSGKDTDE